MAQRACFERVIPLQNMSHALGPSVRELPALDQFLSLQRMKAPPVDRQTPTHGGRWHAPRLARVATRPAQPGSRFRCSGRSVPAMEAAWDAALTAHSAETLSHGLSSAGPGPPAYVAARSRVTWPSARSSAHQRPGPVGKMKGQSAAITTESVPSTGRDMRIGRIEKPCAAGESPVFPTICRRRGCGLRIRFLPWQPTMLLIMEFCAFMDPFSIFTT